MSNKTDFFIGSSAVKFIKALPSNATLVLSSEFDAHGNCIYHAGVTCTDIKWLEGLAYPEKSSEYQLLRVVYSEASCKLYVTITFYD